MNCPNCGQANPAENTVCANCGQVLGDLPDTTILPPAPGSGPAPGTTPLAPGAAGSVEDIGPPLAVDTFERPSAPGPLQRALSAGWGTAVGAAALAFLIMLLVGEGLAALVYAAGGSGGPGISELLRIGGLITYSFHRVGVVASFPDFNLGGLPGGEGGLPAGDVQLTFVIVVAMLLGTLLLFWLLFRAGRSLGRLTGGSPWVRGLSGARVALPYALIAGIGAILLSLMPLRFPIPAIPGFGVGGTVELGPSVIAAFLWPLAIALAAGFAGGVAASPREGWNRPQAESLAVGAMRGGAVMLGWGVLLGFLGFQVLAFVHGDAAIPFNPEFFSSLFEAGALQAVTSLVFVLMFVPNIGALVLAPAMGSSLGIFGGGTSLSFLSYLKFPTGFDPAALAGLSGLGTPGGVQGDLIQTQVAPAPYWLFLVVPLVATVLGGRSAARRAAVSSGGEGAAAGALAGVVYGALVTVVAILAGVGFRVDSGFSGISSSQMGHLGPALLLTALFGLAWGVAGGALGGFLGGRGATPVAPAGANPAFGFDAPRPDDPAPDPGSEPGTTPLPGVPTPPPMAMPPQEPREE